MKGSDENMGNAKGLGTPQHPERLSLENLQCVIEGVEGLVNIARVGNQIFFGYYSEDNRFMTCIVNEVDPGGVSVATKMAAPENQVIGSIMACNVWNTGKSPGPAHGAYAFLAQPEESSVPLLCLQSDLMLAGKMSKKIVEVWVAHFLTSINQWKSTISEALKIMPTDKNLQSGSHPYAKAIVRGAAYGIVRGIAF